MAFFFFFSTEAPFNTPLSARTLVWKHAVLKTEIEIQIITLNNSLQMYLIIKHIMES